MINLRTGSFDTCTQRNNGRKIRSPCFLQTIVSIREENFVCTVQKPQFIHSRDSEARRFPAAQCQQVSPEMPQAHHSAQKSFTVDHIQLQDAQFKRWGPG